MLQNDNNDDIWKPLKIPLRFSESVSRLKGTKCSPIEIQKKESGFLLHTINHSQSNFSPVPLLLNKLSQFAGKKIISSLFHFTLSSLNRRVCTVTLAELTKTKTG